MNETLAPKGVTRNANPGIRATIYLDAPKKTRQNKSTRISLMAISIRPSRELVMGKKASLDARNAVLKNAKIPEQGLLEQGAEILPEQGAEILPRRIAKEA